ncbi:hypothetical protein [Thermohalobaculum sediminis]|uniref:hypothetical protein n=1 Tax=Thermohalobaculum sediminis TaxID=2939436 RepID=UPI003872FDD2
MGTRAHGADGGSLPVGHADRDARDRQHLNGADPERLARLLSALGEPPERARDLAGALADFRDCDSLARGGGADAAAYPPAGHRLQTARSAPSTSWPRSPGSSAISPGGSRRM